MAIEGELPLRELLNVHDKKIHILVSMYNYRDYMDSNNMNRLMSIVIDIIGENDLGIEMLEESFCYSRDECKMIGYVILSMVLAISIAIETLKG